MLFDELSKPLSPDSACGPDLDLEFDPDFMNFLARAEGSLPAKFFQRGHDDEFERPYERGSVNFQPEIKIANELLTRTRDIRILVVLAKFAALDRKLAEFVDVVDAIARLLEAYWEDVNPRAEEGEFALRLAALLTLDDMTHVCLPLQYTPLIRHPRAGPITFRNKLVADGLEPREGEEMLDAGTIRRAFEDIEIETLTAQRDLMATLVAAARKINATTIEGVGHRSAVKLDRLEALSAQILEFLDGFVRERTFGAGPAEVESEAAGEIAPEGAAPAPARVSAVASLADVAATLAGVAAYFKEREPSSPALLLVRQAQQLVGRNFLDVMRILVPDHFDQATIGVGRGQSFDLPLQRLSDQLPSDESEEPAEPPEPVVFADRPSALAALQQVEAYYARNEPSSPTPFLCERARKLSSVDFMTILKEVLPEDALKTQV